MDVYEAISKRKTIRDFGPGKIDPQIIQRILQAGLQAPTNNHLREWHFVLLQDCSKRKELLDQVIHPISKKGAVGIINRWKMTDPIQREMYIDAIPKQYSMLLTCQLLILPFYRQPCPLLKPKTLSDLNAFASIWCCIENILVAAASEGIFGVTRIPGEAERQTIKQFLKIPEGYETPCYLALGYPEDPTTRARQVDISLEDRLHQEGWN